jgi:hypothetical protein
LTPQAIDALATRLRTPLQVQQHLTFALDAGFRAGVTPVSAELVESVLTRKIDDLEPTLTRHGYRVKDLVEQFNAKPAEIQALFAIQLNPTRTAGLRPGLQMAGLPIQRSRLVRCKTFGQLQLILAAKRADCSARRFSNASLYSYAICHGEKISASRPNLGMALGFPSSWPDCSCY